MQSHTTAREPAEAVRLVLGDTAIEIIGAADVERAVSLTGQDVDVESHRKKTWVPAFAGMSGVGG